MQKMARNVLAAGIIVIFNSLSVASVITEDITTSMLFSGGEVAFTIEKFFDGPEEEWNNTYGGEDYDAFFSIAETDNGDLVGFGTINGSGYYRGGDFFLVKGYEEISTFILSRGGDVK